MLQVDEGARVLARSLNATIVAAAEGVNESGLRQGCNFNTTIRLRMNGGLVLTSPAWFAPRPL
jgi:hypothetical protein